MPKSPKSFGKQKPETRSRLTANQRGYNYQWQQASKAFLDENPLCVECLKADRVTISECVDHIIPHKGIERLFWQQSNWQALCIACHKVKTGKGL